MQNTLEHGFSRNRGSTRIDPSRISFRVRFNERAPHPYHGLSEIFNTRFKRRSIFEKKEKLFSRFNDERLYSTEIVYIKKKIMQYWARKEQNWVDVRYGYELLLI